MPHFIKFNHSSLRIMDNLPAASVFKNLKTNEFQYKDGYKLGFINDDTHTFILNNHLTLVLKYHELKTEQ